MLLFMVNRQFDQGQDQYALIDWMEWCRSSDGLLRAEYVNSVGEAVIGAALPLDAAGTYLIQPSAELPLPPLSIHCPHHQRSSEIILRRASLLATC